MDFLKELSITDETIEKIYNNNDRVYIFNFICNKNEVIKNIEYLRKIGITNIDNILINKLNFLVKENESIVKSFNNYDINSLVKIINEDINALNIL